MVNEPLVKAVQPGSLADELGVAPGWRLVSINGQTIGDILDYKIAVAEERLLLRWRMKDGAELELCCDKAFDQDLGVEFLYATLDRPQVCENNCLFCFVDQLPRGMRSTLYVKDDDYRLSFLTGNYITLTNLSWDDLERIVRLRLTPLYVSVQAWDPLVRRHMIRHEQAGDLAKQLDYLAKNEIDLHTQIVLCPGVNDGQVLRETITKLHEYHPAVVSVAVVPVGLTKHRQHLSELRPVDRQAASEVIELVEELSDSYSRTDGTRFVWASDEFYLRAERPIPDEEHYEDFPQLENGVGLVREFWAGWERVQKRLPAHVPEPIRATLITGVSGEYALRPVVEALNKIGQVNLRLQVITNQFFGETVTVTGLITGQDLIRQLTAQAFDEPVIIPDVMLRDGKNTFLDDLTTVQLQEAIAAEVRVVEPSARSLVQALLGAHLKKNVIQRRR
ncbi:MAG: DUF512 domain-containing protein [Bacillota bacterium]